MVPPPNQPSSQDAHIAVADPDDASHPEDNPSSPSDAQSPAAGAVSASEPAAQGQPPAAAEIASDKAEEEPKEWQAQPILLDVQKECFSRLLLLPEILTDHLPDTYLAAVQQL